MLNDEQVKWIIQRLRRETREAVAQAYFNGALNTGGIPYLDGGEARMVAAAGTEWAAMYPDLSSERLDEVIAQYKVASSDPDPRHRCDPLTALESV